jgi:integrase
VERQLVRPDGDNIRFSAPKTRYGKRVITLGAKTIEVLRKHYERQQEERLSAGVIWEEHSLIFTTRNGTPIHPRNLIRYFKKLLDDAGLPQIRFHD